jgi:succinate dehydrogenase/fumarate reductase flavoprotein subunit
MKPSDFSVERISADVLVMGGGIAAVRAALAAAEAGASVRVVSKRRLLEGGAAAVGRSEIMGVAAALGDVEPLDSPEVHYRDTVEAGGAFCRPDLARILVENVPVEIRSLMAWGVPFEQRNGKLLQNKSDYATYPRNCRVDGRTGYEILSVLVQRARAAGVVVDEEVMVARLVRSGDGSLGAIGLSMKSTSVVRYETKNVVMACGGAGFLFSRNVVSPEMSGDGYVAALETGARLINMEFLQFGPGILAAWPLALSKPFYRVGPRFENAQGEDVLAKHLPPGIAPESVLAEKVFPFNGEDTSRFLDIAIFEEQRAGRGTWLRLPRTDELLRRVPHTCRRILDAGLSLTEPLPVGIVLQCFNGGVYMEDQTGRTRVPGLFVAGEVAGGLRAPTRPGGNSLAETLVFGRRAGEAAARERGDKKCANISDQAIGAFLDDLGRPYASRKERSHLAIRKDIHRAAETFLSVLRWTEGLGEARARIGALKAELEKDAGAEGYPADYLTTRNLASVAELVAAAAARREETRGSHLRREYDGRRAEMNFPFMIERAGEELRVEAVHI